MTPDTRRDILIRLLRLGAISGAATGTGVWLSRRSVAPAETLAATPKPRIAVPPAPGLPEMAIAQGDDPRQLVRKAIAELGGIQRFVSRGDVVVIKPNASWDRTPEQAANTKPLVVGGTARLCTEAG